MDGIPLTVLLNMIVMLATFIVFLGMISVNYFHYRKYYDDQNEITY